VVVAPDAVLRHAEASARERRPIDCGPDHPHRVDKAGAVYTLLANARGLLLPYALLRVLLSTTLRMLGYLLGKAPGQAVDEFAGLMHTLLRFDRVLVGRRARARTRDRAEALDDRSLFPAPGATVRLAVEQLIGDLAGRSSGEAAASRHGAVESGPTDDDADFLEVEQFARLRRIARKPAPVLFAALLAVTLLAWRSLLGSGVLHGGALLPTPPGATDLWGAYADSWHTVSGGTTAGSPPYLGVVALLSSVLLGKPGLAVGLLLVLSVPLAGVSAYLVSRPLVDSRLVRAWASATYAFLPAATGAVAQGRLGTAVLAVLLPPLARASAVAVGLGIRRETAERGGRPGWRSTWVAAMLLTLVTAFVPLMWPLAVVLAVGAVAVGAVRGSAFGDGAAAVRGLGPRVAALLATPLLVLAPWSLGLLTNPGRLLLEAGAVGATGTAATPTNLLLLDPGGSGAVPGLLTAGVLLAALAALLRADRRRAVLAAWGAAAVGLLGAVAIAGTQVSPGPGQAAVPAWAGPATLLAGVALLGAAAIGADGARERVTGIDFGWRQPVAALVLAAAALAPLAAAGWWVVRGAGGPLARGSSSLLPAFIGEEAASTDRPRTLVLRTTASGGAVSFSLVRDGGPTLGDAELAAATPAPAGLSDAIGSLLSGSGGDPVSKLTGYGVEYVLVQKPITAAVQQALDATPGLVQLNQQQDSAIWRVGTPVSRVVVRGAAGGQAVSVPAGEVDVRTTLPAGPSGRVLRLADQADAGWQATLDGTALTPVTLDGWAQGFQLPASGGRLVVTYRTSVVHKAWIAAQALLAAVLVVLALPGRKDRTDDDLPEEMGPVAALAEAAPGSRRARRLAAAAAATEGGAEAVEDGIYAAQDPPGAEPEPQPPAPPQWQEPAPYPEQPAAYQEQQPYGWDPYAYPQQQDAGAYYGGYGTGYGDPYGNAEGYGYGNGHGNGHGTEYPGGPEWQGYEQAQPQPAHDPGAYGSLTPDDPWLNDNGDGTYHQGSGS
jgi:hypothetical protein